MTNMKKSVKYTQQACSLLLSLLRKPFKLNLTNNDSKDNLMVSTKGQFCLSDTPEQSAVDRRPEHGWIAAGLALSTLIEEKPIWPTGKSARVCVDVPCRRLSHIGGLGSEFHAVHLSRFFRLL